jgi:hypothetical protein
VLKSTAFATALPLDCGDIITQSTALTANIGPCPGTGLSIQSANVTLELNGYTISSQGSGTDVDVVDIAGNVVVTGSGKIGNFATGIAVRGARKASIHDITLARNTTGISLSSSGGHPLFANGIRNGSAAIAGIRLGRTRTCSGTVLAQAAGVKTCSRRASRPCCRPARRTGGKIPCTDL